MSINIKSIDNCDVENSVEQISALVYEGFKFKFTKKLFHDQEVLDVITAFCKYIISVKPEKLFVSESNGKLSGCLFLTTSGEKYYDFYYSLKKSLSFSQCLRLLLLLSVLSHKPQYNERYIDFLVVAPEFRNKGIGETLVTYCKNTFPKEDVTLHVAEKNYRAYHLYNKIGFKVTEQKSSLIMELVVGLRRWRLMKWEK